MVLFLFLPLSGNKLCIFIINDLSYYNSPLELMTILLHAVLLITFSMNLLHILHHLLYLLHQVLYQVSYHMISFSWFSCLFVCVQVKREFQASLKLKVFKLPHWLSTLYKLHLDGDGDTVVFLLYYSLPYALFIFLKYNYFQCSSSCHIQY